MSDEMGGGFEPVGVRKMTLKPASFDGTPHTCENCKWLYRAEWETEDGECSNGKTPVGGMGEEHVKTFSCNQWEGRNDNR